MRIDRVSYIWMRLGRWWYGIAGGGYPRLKTTASGLLLPVESPITYCDHDEPPRWRSSSMAWDGFCRGYWRRWPVDAYSRWNQLPHIVTMTNLQVGEHRLFLEMDPRRICWRQRPVDGYSQCYQRPRIVPKTSLQTVAWDGLCRVLWFKTRYAWMIPLQPSIQIYEGMLSVNTHSWRLRESLMDPVSCDLRINDIEKRERHVTYHKQEEVC